MKQLRAIIVASMAPAVLVTGCGDIFGVDNYDGPNAYLTGNVVYNGEPVGVRLGGPELELWEPGWELEEKIPVTVDQDGSFSAHVFNGDYEVNLLAGSGPWVDNTERVAVQVRGDTTVDIDVTPYYIIENATVTNVGGTIEAAFSVGEVETSRDLERVGVFVGTARIVAQNRQEANTQVVRADIDDLNDINISVDLPSDVHLTPSPEPRTHVFVRIGVKTVGVSEWLFTQVHEVEL